MIMASVVKQLLVLLRYPKFESPDQLLGPHAVGALKVRLPGSTGCQIHYPTVSTASPNDDPSPYFRPQAAEGMANYTRMSPALLEFLSHKPHPCLIRAEPDDTQQFPLVFFSHGLAGCMELYTQLCAQVASHGYIVVALEHQDGSACYAEESSAHGQPIAYQRPDDTPYSRAKVLRFRLPMLQHRVREVEAAIRFFLSAPQPQTGVSAAEAIKGHAAANDQTLLDKIVSIADVSQGVSLLGHSFGGATMVLAEQQLATTTSSGVDASPGVRIKSVAILDAWCFALPDKVLDTGTEAPLLSVVSDTWKASPETAQLVQLLDHSDRSVSLWAPDTVHQSVSDTGSWLPRWVGRKLRMRGANEVRFGTPRVVGQACASHMLRSATTSGGSNDFSSLLEAGTLRPFTKEKKSMAMKT